MVLSLLLGILVVIGLHTTAQPDGAALVHTPTAVRIDWFRRVRSDLPACRELQASTGPLRSHCQEQARFILQFPECDTDCRQTARAVLGRTGNPR